MKLRLRPRYFVVLLWHWLIPFSIGLVVSFMCTAHLLLSALPEIELALSSAIREACK